MNTIPTKDSRDPASLAFYRSVISPVLIVVVLAASAECTSAKLLGQSKLTGELAGTSSRVITPECHKSIERGTKWLVTAITRRGVSAEYGQPADLSCTSIVGLALLSQGNTLSGGYYQKEVRQILDAVLNRIDEIPESGYRYESLTLVQRKIGRNSELFLSALFLSQMLGDCGPRNTEIRQALEKIVSLIARTQGEDGTWGDESWAPVLGTVLGWESLRASSSCGLKIEASAELAGKALLAKLQVKSASESGWMHDLYKDASSIRVLHSLHYRRDPLFQECVERIVSVAKNDNRPFIYAGGEEFLAFFLATECLLQEPQPSWASWYPTVRDKLVRIQNRDGSWTGHHCITSRTFCTAAALLTLQAPHRFLPMSDL